MPPRPRPLADRFWEKVLVPLRDDGSLLPDSRQCWLWIGAKCGGRPGGGAPYGTMKVAGGKQRKAHVVAYFLVHDKWPILDVCHQCDVTLCCNPAHLFEAAHQDNMMDYIRKYGRLAIPKTEWPLPPRPKLPLEETEDGIDRETVDEVAE
jgi:hypothetical protein